MCIGPWATPDWFGTLDSGLASFYGFLSVAIYIGVYYKYRFCDNILHFLSANQERTRGKLIEKMGKYLN